MIRHENARELILSATGFDIGHYNPDQMNRLLSTIMIRAGVKSLEEYIEFLKRDLKHVQEFKNFITINVSEFFRDKNAFEFLRNSILPQFLNQPGVFHAWSAGCAQGEEAYSLAILLEENKHLLPCYRILATDIDDEALEKARRGIYPEVSLKNLPEHCVKKYFQNVDKNRYHVNTNLQLSVKFERQDLLTPSGLEKFDLVLCRNVVIYFTVESKRKIYENVVRAIRPGGVLFIGSTETLLSYRDFGLEKIETYFYRKPPVHPKR